MKNYLMDIQTSQTKKTILYWQMQKILLNVNVKQTKTVEN